MTNWTIPTTWTALQVPTAANLDTHWRDNLLHLRETIHGFGFVYAPCDPRLITTATYQFARPFYIRSYGRGNVYGFTVRISTSSGNITVGAYSNLVTEAFPKGVPGVRRCTSSSITCPAIGVTNFLTVEAVTAAGNPTIEPRDWLAWAGTGAAFGYGGQGSTGWSFYGPDVPVVSFVDVDASLTDLPDTADPNIDSSSGSAAGLMIIGNSDVV